MKLIKSMTAVAVTSLVATSAWATNGYAPHGIGQKSKGMGGVGIALVQDTVGAGMNPAGMVLLGNRVDAGLEWFRPSRKTEIMAPNPFAGSYSANDRQNFFVPEFGYNYMLNDRMSLGVSVFGNGGMNTDYANGIPLFTGVMSGKRTSIDLMQLFVVPTFAWKINDQHSIGIGLNLAAQQFTAVGLQNFDNPAFTSSPGKVTNNDPDWSYGAGLRIGWVGQITDRVTLGATYQTRTYMSEFDDYKGLFAEQGDFDIPENFGAGIAFKATPKLTLAFDIMRINYSSVNSIGNKGPSGSMGPPAMTGTPLLGESGGWGFGWDDQTVYKLGAAYEYNADWTFRAGWNHGSSPISGSETLFNVLAPGVVEDHLTLGATWTLDNGQEVTFSYMHAFENTVKGNNSIPAWMGGGEADISMYQDSFGVAWGMDL